MVFDFDDTLAEGVAGPSDSAELVFGSAARIGRLQRLLERLRRANVACAVCSFNERRTIGAALAAAGLLRHMAAVVGAEQFEDAGEAAWHKGRAIRDRILHAVGISPAEAGVRAEGGEDGDDGGGPSLGGGLTAESLSASAVHIPSIGRIDGGADGRGCAAAAVLFVDDLLDNVMEVMACFINGLHADDRRGRAVCGRPAGQRDGGALRAGRARAFTPACVHSHLRACVLPACIHRCAPCWARARPCSSPRERRAGCATSTATPSSDGPSRADASRRP